MLTVTDILKSKDPVVFQVSPAISVYEAIRVMGEHNIGAVLVMEDGQLKGILSERDYARKIVLKNRKSMDTLVSEIMTQQVITIAPGDSIDQCMNLMSEHKIRHLPVISEDKVVGIVSIGDLVKAIISAQQATIEHLQNYIAQ